MSSRAFVAVALSSLAVSACSLTAPRSSGPALVSTLAIPAAPPTSSASRVGALAPADAIDPPTRSDETQLVVGVFHVPALSIWADRDTGEFAGDVHWRADLTTGTGMGFELGAHGAPVGARFLYMNTEHVDRNGGGETEGHAGFVELYAQGHADPDDLSLGWYLGAGIGMTYFDFEVGREDERGLAGEVRGGLSLSLGPHVSADAGVGYLKFGRPTETVGRGVFATAGLSLFL